MGGRVQVVRGGLVIGEFYMKTFESLGIRQTQT